MAVIAGVTLAPVLSDISFVMPNAMTSIGDTTYFAYTNTSNDGVLMSSTDGGVTWSLVQNFGQIYRITVVTCSEGLAVGVTTSGRNRVYVNGALRISGSSNSSGGCVYVEPYLVTVNLPGDLASCVVASKDWSGTDPTSFATAPPIYAALGQGTGPGTISVVASLSFDPGVGWSGLQAATFSRFRVARTNPNVPGSEALLFDTTTHATGTDARTWPGLASRSLTGYMNNTDFAGIGVGGASQLNFDTTAQAMRGTYFTGYGSGAQTIIADRGLIGPHQAATFSTVEGNLVAFFLDKNGLLGTTVASAAGAITDSSGATSPFDKAKIYGNKTLNYALGAYSAPVQSSAFSAFLVVQKDAFTKQLYRLHDPNVLDRPHAQNAQLLSTVPTVNQLAPDTQSSAGGALGTARSAATLPSYGIDLLRAGCVEPNVLPNPNHSTGCSPVLRELLRESGVPFSVVREIANDGDTNGHQGGNAIDVAGPDSPTILSGSSITDAQYQQMAEICRYLRAVPSLFASVIHYDPISPSNSLFIWDGHVTTVDQFGGVQSALVQAAIGNIHISSSRSRLIKTLTAPAIAAALGLVDNGYADTTGGASIQPEADPFASNRYVYVNQDGYVGGQTQGQSAEKQTPLPVHFW